MHTPRAWDTSIKKKLNMVHTAQIGSKSEFGGRRHLLEAVGVDAALDGEHPVALEQRGPGAFNRQSFVCGLGFRDQGAFG